MQHNSGRLVKKSFQNKKFDGERPEGCRLQLLGMWRTPDTVGLGGGANKSRELKFRQKDARACSTYILLSLHILQFHLIRVIYERRQRCINCSAIEHQRVSDTAFDLLKDDHLPMVEAKGIPIQRGEIISQSNID